MMRLQLLLLLLVSALLALQLAGQDLPANISANLELIESGSYLIPLDNEKQSTMLNDPLYNVDYSGFNLAAYGLIHGFLQNDVPVQWVIRTGKLKDEIDASVLSHQKYPTEEATQVWDYRSSFFVVKASDIAASYDCLTVEAPGVDQIIFQFGSDVAVYESDEDMMMDVRYTLQREPIIAALSDGPTDGEPHYTLLDEAKIPYELLSSQEFFQEYSCYTFISQPHLGFINNNQYINSLSDFLDNGGNFLAHCISVRTFEEAGEYLTTNGLDLASGDNGGGVDNQTYNESFFDMPIMQYEGDILPSLTGQLSSFELDNGSAWLPNSYVCINNQDDDYVLAAGDVNGAQLGGNVFYIGGHEINSECFEEYLSDQNPDPIGDDFAKIQQFKRTYLNAAFVPADVNYICAGNNKCACPGDSVLLGCAGLPTDGSVQYTWLPGNGLSCTDCPNPMAAPITTTTYSLSSSDNCSSSDVTVYVIDAVGTTVVSGGGTHCGQGVELEITVDFLPPNIALETILFNDGIAVDTLAISEASSSITVFDVGTYTVQHLNDFSCSSDYQGAPVVNSLPELTIDLGADIEICSGESHVFTLNIDPTATIIWEGGAQGQTFETDVEGEYWVYVQLDGCEASDTVELSLLPNPQLDLGPDQLKCGEDSIVLDAGREEVIWQDGSTGQFYQVTEAGTYSVTTEEGLCAADDSVVVSSLPEPPLPNLGPDLTFCRMVTANIGVNAPGDFDYLWNTGATTPIITVNASGTYWLEVSNECGSKFDSLSITTEMGDVGEDIYILPDAFSPNGDQLNDVFRPFPLVEEVPLNFRFQIYNRWGNLLFESSDPAVGWEGFDGSSSGPVGVFLWMVDAEFEFCGEKETYFSYGNVTLIR